MTYGMVGAKNWRKMAVWCQTWAEIFNGDQGSQFTSKEFTGRLEELERRISMDSRGRVFDNILIERLGGV